MPFNESEQSPGLSRILGNVTHELKTPLHSMMAVAQLLQSEVDGPLNEEQRKQVSMILRNGEQLLELITNLLQYTNLESRTQTPHIERFSAKLLFSEIAHTLEPLTMKQQIRFERNFESLVDEFISDRTLIRLIASNLLSNALKFSPPESTLSFYAASLHSGALLIEVADSGIGIPLDAQQKIFGEFFQMESSDSRRFGGVGLGLSLVRSAVSALGGQIEVRSEAGQGSLFRVTIPSASELVKGLRIGTYGVDPVSRFAITESLRKDRHEILDLPAIDGRVSELDLLFVESAELPRIVSEVRLLSSPRPGIVVLSAMNTAEERAAAKGAGADEFLAKPFDLADLIAVTERYRAA